MLVINPSNMRIESSLEGFAFGKPVCKGLICFVEETQQVLVAVNHGNVMFYDFNR